MSQEASNRVAWLVEVNDWTAVAFAATAPKARWIAVKSYWEAFGKDGWPSVKATRAPEHDRSHVLADPRAYSQVWGEEYV